MTPQQGKSLATLACIAGILLLIIGRSNTTAIGAGLLIAGLTIFVIARLKE